MYYFSTLFW